MMTVRESVLWWPLLCAAACALAMKLGSRVTPGMLLMLGAVFETSLFEKIERFRDFGLHVDTAAALAAEQSHVDEDELIVAHFAWCVEAQDVSRRRSTAGL